MNPARFQIRRATAADLAVASRLAAKLVRLHHDWDPQRFASFGEPLERGYEQFLAAQIRASNAAVLVAEDRQADAPDSSIVGYAFGSVEGRDWMILLDGAGWIHDVFVDDAVRGQGIGEALVERMIEELRARGAPRIVLQTAWKNDPARRLFERLGFRPTLVEMTREIAMVEPPRASQPADAGRSSDGLAPAR